MLWFEQWLEWWRWLIPSWHVVLISATEQILGVDTPGHHVAPHVRYGTTCLLIRNAIGYVSCSDEWEWASFFVSYTPGQYVPPHVWYGTACLLIRNAIGCVSCSDEWEWASFFVSYM
jgi:hypothetical protein